QARSRLGRAELPEALRRSGKVGGMRAVALVLGLALLSCAHEPRLPPPANDEQRAAADLLQRQRADYEEYHTARRADCSRRCMLAERVCRSARRVCEIGEANPRDEGLPAYCSLASRRCQRADDRLRYECHCWASTTARPD